MKFEKIIIMGLAVLLSSGLTATELTMTQGGGWRQLEDGGYELNYTKGWPWLRSDVKIQPDTFYKLSWKTSSTISSDRQNFVFSIQLNNPESKGHQQYHFTKARQSETAYFYSGKNDHAVIGFYIEQLDATGNVFVNAIHLDPVPAADLTRNLLPDGNFEQGDGWPVNWTKGYKSTASAQIVPCTDFLSGDKCLQVDFNGKGGIQSIQLPVIPGKEFELKFWAKSPQDFVIKSFVRAWSMFGHKDDHFYKMKEIKITPEWKEYSLKLTIPDDFAKYPDLDSRLMFLSINSSGKTGRVFFNDISFRQVENKDTQKK